MKEWLISGRFHRNRDWILNILWPALAALSLGLAIGSEFRK
jgi:hypothetical protein